MSGSEPSRRWERRIEMMLRVAGPALDLLLAVGDRVSRLLEPDDPDYIPARMAGDGESAPRGLRRYPPAPSGPDRSSPAVKP